MEIFSNLFAHAIALSALAVVAIQQILKLNLIPGKFANRYPVPTLIILSVLAAIGVDIKGLVKPVAWTDWVVLAATIGVTAAITYRATIKNWSQLRTMEGEG